MKKHLLVLLLIVGFTAAAQDKQGYQLFTANGKKTTYKALVKANVGADVVLFGELHDNSIVHWLEYELAADVIKQKPVILGAEMIEADNQQVLNRYLAGEINQKQLDSLARLWQNHKTDYKTLVDFAKENKLPFVAANVPRRYASQVYKKGLESLEALPADEKAWMAPLPIAYDASLPGYKAMLEMGGGHGGDNLPKAQAIKDATMAWFISQNIKPGSTFIHYNGSYHSENYEGISWYLNQYKPGLKIVTIAAVSQKDLDKLETEHLKKADFIIVVDDNMTKTY
ncbi:ChaN family lipoprotein [Flavobacterium sp. RHBU_3]|uniref:ChaN family lipoprotein n=1 Tax=Flavobacterium sp. RHBU_3 TaxID=3391184 RepID=UPI0039853A08